jgi:hypothetical protein
VIGPILADLIGPTFVIFVSAAEKRKEKRQTFFFPDFPHNWLYRPTK